MSPDIVILAAGLGKRMRSQTAKVLHPVLGRPMLHYILETALETPHGALVAVVGHERDQVIKESKDFPGLQFAVQEKPMGTGRAVLQTKPIVGGLGRTLLVLSGDVILLRTETIQRMIEAKVDGVSAVVLTTRLDNPTGYGRIIRGQGSQIAIIREEKDCSASERNINEINAGIYLFDSEKVFAALEKITPNNAQNEYYLTDVITHLNAVALEVIDPTEVLGINDRIGLSQVESILQRRINTKWMAAGVSFENPENTYVDSRSRFSSDIRIENGCHIVDSKIGEGTVIESGARIIRSTIGENVVIRQGCYIVESRIGNSAAVGPFAHLRPGSVLGNKTKIGNFVEIKNSTVGEESKASHLSYIGDATVGSNVNLGCGFITCNYDGSPKKHRTTIGDGVFVGSDSQTVAPIEIGAGSYVASGTTVTENVPQDSLVISRGRQVTKMGYARRYRKRD